MGQRQLGCLIRFRVGTATQCCELAFTKQNRSCVSGVFRTPLMVPIFHGEALIKSARIGPNRPAIQSNSWFNFHWTYLTPIRRLGSRQRWFTDCKLQRVPLPGQRTTDNGQHTTHNTQHTSHITHHTSHITHHTSHITHRTSHIAHRTSHIAHRATWAWIHIIHFMIVASIESPNSYFFLLFAVRGLRFECRGPT